MNRNLNLRNLNLIDPNSENIIEAYRSEYAENPVDFLYYINSNEGKPLGSVMFQDGPKGQEGSLDGIYDADLLEIVRDRLRAMQKGNGACEYNVRALTHIEEALYQLKLKKEYGYDC